MKKYKVEGFSELMDAEMNVNSVEQASDVFEMFMDSDSYYKGHIMDNCTGEIYCWFVKEIDSEGVKLTYWTAFN